MTKEDRWAHLIDLDNELLKGGVVLSEWCAFIVREADVAFCSQANLATILTAVSGIETYLRSEYSITRKERLVELINQSAISTDLKADLNTLRKYRNKWVHVDNSQEDEDLLINLEATESELEKMALFAVRALRRVIYENPWI